jgi:hypothetical protein
VGRSRHPTAISTPKIPARARTRPERRFIPLEDQGIPPALATLTGQGAPLLRSLDKGRRGMLLVLITILRSLLRLALDAGREIVTNYRERGKILFRS